MRQLSSLMFSFTFSYFDKKKKKVYDKNYICLKAEARLISYTEMVYTLYDITNGLSQMMKRTKENNKIKSCLLGLRRICAEKLLRYKSNSTLEIELWPTPRSTVTN